MLVTTPLEKSLTVKRLLNLWASRYVPDLSTLSLTSHKCTTTELMEAASPQGREKTASKLSQLIEIHCKCAGIRTSILFSYIPNVVNLTESQGIATSSAQVYQKVLSVYQKQSPNSGLITALSQVEAVDISTDLYKVSVMPKLELPEISSLVTILTPELMQFQSQHLSASNQKILGFMSTQFHLSSKVLLNRLSLPEQLLLSPYFKFIEEQVCIPWQRVCAAAGQHSLNSPILALVEQLLPKSQEIAARVYRKALELYPNYRSRRGKLDAPEVKASSIRDVEMFQAYLWVCVLEQNMAAMEKELFPLCEMVYPSVNVSWELVDKMVKLLVEKIIIRLDTQQKSIVQPYTTAMQKLFACR
ncbi:hypothetical protein [Coleofasciculus sp. G2-EDA-02]|uniref:hypothetical protein n=1 Tax=Coleofasciculus sp. G2-EDA-02 TaxID=3069529 RepID=UPI0032FA6FCC